jgi:pilus assembly protein Flp/PilA
MNRHEIGQGLVEYALILVLVAIVVIAIIALLGPSLGGVFCDAVFALRNLGDWGMHVDRYVSMNPGELSVTFNAVYPEGDTLSSCNEFVKVWDVGEPSHGDVALYREDNIFVFTYYPTNPNSETDDSFTFSWSHALHGSQVTEYTGLVTIVVGEPDLAISQSNILNRGMNTTQDEDPESELDDVQEDIFALLEAAEEQEENFQEGVDLAVEAVEEGLEVLIEFADETANSLLSDSLSQLLQEVRDGDLDAVSEVFEQVVADLAEAPLEVLLDMMLKMAPRIIESCVEVSEGTVSPDTIEAAVQAVQGLDEDLPGRAEALQLLQFAVATIEERNNAAQEYTDFQSALLEFFVAGFELAGEEDLAEQLAADSEACGN